MENIYVKDLIEKCNAKLIYGNPNEILENFSKDTRTIKNNDIYIGIKGSNFNGNLFYEEAFNKGAKVCIIEENSIKLDDLKKFDNKTLVIVDDSIETLRILASYKRSLYNIPIVGVTGSNGKTCTRDLIYSVVNKKYKTLKTDGNFNNNIGLPLTLLRLTDEKAAIIEMGMNALGEIDYLTKITKPNIGIITNVGTAHIGKLGSRENILKAKLEILNGIDKNGKLIINNDNDLLHNYYLKNKNDNVEIITVGIENDSDYTATNIEMTGEKINFDIVYKNKKYPIVLNIPNKVFIYNCLYAFAVGNILNIETDKIKSGIENFELTKNRSEIFKIKNNITIINDSYNASLDSMKSSLEMLANVNGKRKIAILGSMLELGEFSESLHRKVGEEVYKNNIDILITVGDDAKFIALEAEKNGMNKENIYSFSDNQTTINKLKEILKKEDAILLKASNGLHFNQIVEKLKTDF